MPESFLLNAQLTGLDRQARRTEILRAKQAAALEARVAALEASTTPTAWTNITYNGNWVNYGSGFEEGSYRKIGDIVYLRGLIKNTGDANAPAVNICTLPAGFRPPGTAPLLFVCDGYNNGAGAYTDARVNVWPTGVVSMEDAEQVNGTIGYLSLDGVYFSTVD